jgi:hypothetical protein
MRALRLVETEHSGLVGLGARVLLLAPEAEEAARLTRLIAGFGGLVDHEAETYAALSALIDDPRDWDMFVMACDGIGGIEAGRRAHRMLGDVAARVPTILISQERGEQTFPEAREEPILLRARMSAAALRLGMEHALRGRMAWRFG